MKRLPAEAQQVFDEIVAKQRRRIRVTQMEKEERIDKSFENLTMGGGPMRNSEERSKSSWRVSYKQRCLCQMQLL